jgi:hypothetical protein
MSDFSINTIQLLLEQGYNDAVTAAEYLESKEKHLTIYQLKGFSYLIFLRSKFTYDITSLFVNNI